MEILECVKHNLPMISTERGMQIDSNEQLKKHDWSIRVNLDSDSKVNASSFESAKHESPRISTE
jgi:hypothetical protein